MPRRSILTPRQQAALFGLPEDEQTILRYYTLSDEDIRYIQEKRKPQNRIGFASQLCAFRYPGRFLQPREVIPTQVLSFIGAQLGIDEDALVTYGQRQQTKHEHSKQLQAIYGFTPLAGEVRAQMQQWLI
jgi:TnpA family transposase